MKKITFWGSLFLLFASVTLKAQCLQIEGILADACNLSGQFSEPYNEMVRFKTGSTALPINQLSISGKGNTGAFNPNKWPNSNQLWHGLVQNANTASKVSTINSTILACGFVKEPPAGIIPANAEVIMVCSQYMNPTSNSFANLNDTIYMVFQDTVSSATSGHFANYSAGTSYRWLVLIDNAAGCSDTVKYDVSLLANHNDGDAIEYDVAGNPTYVNYGCQAPYIPLTIDAGANQTICFNDSAVITATPNGLYSGTQWSLANAGDGSLIAPTALTSTYVPSGTAVSPVKIYITLFTVCGTSVKDSMMVTITPAPAPAISGNGNSVCTGSNFVLNVNQQSSTTYTWLPGNATGNSYTVSPTSQTVYTVNASNNCSSSNATFTLNVNALPTLTIANDTICSGSTGTLTASGASTYTWNTSATGSSLNSSPSSTTQFTATGTDANGCKNTASAQIVVNQLPSVSSTSASICPGATATLTASGAATYTWSTTQTGTSISVSPSVNTTYTVTGTDANGCTNSAVTNVNTNALPNVNVSNSSICPGATATLTANGAVTYTWSTSQTGGSISVSPATATNYTVTGTDASGCVNSAVASVTINPIPTVSVNSPSACQNASTTLTASGAVTYSWSTAQTGTSISVPGNVASYTVTGTDANGCSNTAVASVSIMPLPTAQTIMGNTVICNGQSVVLSVAPGTYTYTWSGPGGVIGGGFTASVNQAGVYTLTTSNSCGSVVSQFTVSVSLVHAGFAPNIISGQSPATFTFTNSSTGTQLSDYWNMGNGNTSTQVNPVETYTLVGTYDVSLTVTDVYGCKDSTHYTVFVSDTTPPVIIPNIFTPNGDSLNDVFTIKCNALTYLNCQIYDRWGLLLYEWNGVNGGWDGKNSQNGLAVTDGTYYFLVTYMTVQDKLGIKNGFVQLVR